MRLLKVSEQRGEDDLPKLVDFLPDQIPPYAILSHRWNSDPSQEVLFADLVQCNKYSINTLREKQGYHKLQSSCAQARKYELDYLWVGPANCCLASTSADRLARMTHAASTKVAALSCQKQ